MSTSTPAGKNPNNVNVSRDDAKSSTGTCPLMKGNIQLVPLRYGLVNGTALDPSSEIAVPYKLGTRPLGIRLLRDGWLYVIDSQNGELSEYRLIDGVVSAMLWQGREVQNDSREQPIKKPVLAYSKRSTLYVSYSEIQWTAKKCAQVIKSQSERKHFMQAIDLGQANCETGGPSLLTPALAERWLAEVATARIQSEAAKAREEAERVERRKRGEPEVEATFIPVDTVYGYPEHERIPYLWEMPQRFRESSMSPLSSCIEEEYRQDVLYLVVEDHIGVLRDLANYQDQVVDWIDTWAKGGSQDRANERDYLLACYIESLTLLTRKDIGALADASDDPDIKRMLGDLDDMKEPEQGTTRQLLVEYLNRGGLPTPPQGSPVPPELTRLQQQALDEAMQIERFLSPAPDYTASSRSIEDTDRRYYTREHFNGAPQDFVEKHFEALLKLGKEQDRRIKDALNGAKMGQRGINELIDRGAMDDALLHRQSLKRWNTLLDNITADRTAMLCAGRFHKSAWYYDPQNTKQVGQAFATEYACLKDICRSDEACVLILQYLEKEPQFSRPMFYALPYSEQTAVWAQYAFAPAAGMTLFNSALELVKKLREIESPRLPALDMLPEDTRAVADAAQQTMTPALNRGIEKVLADFDQVLKGQPMPDLDQLFRRLPKALPTRILDAAKREGVTFTVATDDEKTALKNTLKDLFEEKEHLQKLNRERNKVKQTAGHRSSEARRLQTEIQSARQQLAGTEARLAGALSPIGDLPDNSVRVFGATPVRAGITVVFPPASQQEISGLMRNFRNGAKTAPKLNLMGDGAALLLFVVQALNLRQVFAETYATSKNQRTWRRVWNASMATGAAGFAAAQGVFDTALTARSSVLAKGLQNHAVAHLQVQMGKLHIGLGAMTYVFGVFAAGASLNNYQSSWEQAVRSGNDRSQNGAIMSMAGSGGLLASNLYGLGHTLEAAYTVFLAERGAARTTAWAASGVRLSGIFFRANLAGALFTALELGGNYVYNYYNTSAHDQWLQSTPWGLDASKRQSLSLAEYQNALTAIVQAPSVQVGRVEHGTWWKNLLSSAKVGDIHLLLPGLDTTAFLAPLGGKPSHQLHIGAYRINKIRVDRALTSERWAPLSEAIDARLRRVDDNQIILCVGYPEPLERIVGKTGEELMLVVAIQSPHASGQPQQKTHYIRFDPRGSGAFPSVDRVKPLPHALLLPVEPLMLEVVAHV
ncbi:toxin VasX [Pseudomonas sp. EA_65y_Pfl1_P120]|uniref:toxin VasX n=1 Tax=Pseudomonas sp. EA_65y_Pfl1_P120 TaxID=3088693 RepID=UPI0030D9708E